ncbi:hypothetical protein B9Q13_04505 [Candidatus Marsarchaeota G2 archaeon ECH_B_SAG-G16]|jgi:proteasome lid subunit RPN8/RPN11|uniref:JAB domain-containing protein n=4 Tax=Candidatus Marsarchaeota TaxID=1978152 RepID=A0A2R6AHJ5_9ARCH|nr:MAG: hypothetical protein B9Q01_01500 [Candidatus Marsarchaeota G1 archaeon OSP_D]PSN85837.1 MAG: hypothetical protein B9Q02_04595 [Candidatus Marsarchaeota G1 archaeon BE_D]PSN91686.1 MAG: hypothetical protein B9P99_03865 [Candidatus Marsarchaeota G1 archaeon OSP_B]PSO04449.1 MAG: hypothetical protein B9Q13_04505 [Candidatus Marsarchaeota G2 archaeon ECH_B_SAG-G16]
MVYSPRHVTIEEEALGFLMGYAKGAYPREAIVILRGVAKQDGEVFVEESVLPPKRVEGHGFSQWSLMGVADFRLVGIGHSHPSGVLKPSDEDLLNFAGKVLLIVGPPFSSERDAAFFDRFGNSVPFSVKWKGKERTFKIE